MQEPLEAEKQEIVDRIHTLFGNTSYSRIEQIEALREIADAALLNADAIAEDLRREGEEEGGW